ncbi:ubiquitin-conjugating enzyme E2 22-like isoform X2 [Wolffia australiana]
MGSYPLQEYAVEKIAAFFFFYWRLDQCWDLTPTWEECLFSWMLSSFGNSNLNFCLSLMATNENLTPNVIKQLVKELKNLDETPPEGIKVVVINDDFSSIFADIDGPAGTPYENGNFRVKLAFHCDFPQSPPRGFFLTKIFHPNISSSGEICVNTLKKDWNPTFGLRHVLLVIRCLLIEPFPESALNEQAAKMLLEDYREYARHARLYTGIHATKPKPKLTMEEISESTMVLNVEQSPRTAASADGSCASAMEPLSPAPRPTASDGSRRMQVADEAATKAPAADKKKIDAQKKSLKRL